MYVCMYVCMYESLSILQHTTLRSNMPSNLDEPESFLKWLQVSSKLAQANCRLLFDRFRKAQADPLTHNRLRKAQADPLTQNRYLLLTILI